MHEAKEASWVDGRSAGFRSSAIQRSIWIASGRVL